MRHELSGYEGRFGRWYGTFASFARTRIDINANQNGLAVALIKDVADATGEHVADHLWLDWGILPYYGWLVEGAFMEFNGKVAMYRKYDKELNLWVDDFKITAISGVKRIELY